MHALLYQGSARCGCYEGNKFIESSGQEFLAWLSTWLGCWLAPFSNFILI